MFPRLSRVGFIVSRSVFLSLFIIVIMRILSFFTANDALDAQLDAGEWGLWMGEQKAFWKTLAEQDKALTDAERVEQVKLRGLPNDHQPLNWTNIFWDIYSRKSTQLKERNSKTPHKRFLERPTSAMAQSIIDIFEETTVFDKPKFCSTKRIFHPDCPFTNCRWLCEEPVNSGNDGPRRASVFHHSDIKHEDMPRKSSHRSWNDIWILWNDEANYDMKKFNGYKFNWTLSYRQDAEVSVGSYGLLIKKTQRRTVPNFQDSPLIHMLIQRNIPIPDIDLESRIYTNFRYRHRYAFWLVSNCFAKRRLDFYSRLKEHYPVKAFGQCVEAKCEKNDHCQSQHSHLAMFYLAFESQTCTDYITEKFWRAVSFGMIPVVLGPSKQSYLDLNIPASAFIHVDDFSSAKELAIFLGRIALNYHLYREYFQWLTEYSVFSNIDDLEPVRMCEMCMRLNMQRLAEHSFYADLHEWSRAGC